MSTRSASTRAAAVVGGYRLAPAAAAAGVPVDARSGMQSRGNAAVRVLAVLTVIGALMAAEAVAQSDARRGTEVDLATLDTVEVRSIRVDGSSVFTAAELAAAVAPYEQRAITFEELDELRHALSQRYAARGYVSSGVVIPDQRILDGVVTLQAVEGGLTDITVSGNRRLRERTIERRIEHRLGVPLNVNDLQAALHALQEDPLIQRIDAQLLPGEALGESHLRLGVTERPPLDLAVIASNDRSASVGEDRGLLGLTYRGLIGNGDVLSGQLGLTSGVRDSVLSYSVPIGAGGTALELLLTDQDADIVEDPFDTLDIESRLESWSVTATRPFVEQSGQSVTGIAYFEHKRSESTLLGMPFSFSPGDIDGKAEGSSVGIGAEWIRRGAAQAWSARATLRVGVDALDAMVRAAGPDGRFTAFLGQFQYLRQLAWRGSEVLVRQTVQIAFDPLLAMYKLPIGGRYTVRGYRENSFVRDNGAAVSAEYRFAPWVDATGQPRGRFELAVFADYGVSWDEDNALATSREERIASVGLGTLWNPIPWLNVEVYWGDALDEPSDPGESLQDRGIHYRVAFQKSFRKPL
ncbi:MAG TPA: POTRA domain-containing protein [Gammaproteobacteria bacterium]